MARVRKLSFAPNAAVDDIRPVVARLLDAKRDGVYPFSYTPSHATDIKRTFERIRRVHERNDVVRPARRD